MDERKIIADEIERLVPILGKKKAAKLEVAYLLGDENYRKRILEIVDALRATVVSDESLKGSVLIQPPERHVAAVGEFQLGTVLYGQKELYPLMLNKSDLLTHIGVFGSSGSGKTNIVHYLTQVLKMQDIPILIFDFSKRNYRDLLQLPELKDRIKVYTVGRDVIPFRFNPFKPPEGVQISQWVKEFAEVFDHAYWLLGGGKHVIMKALDGLYKMHDPSYPKMEDLKMWIDKIGYKEISSRERNWVSTAKRPLEALCMRETGEIFDCEEGVTPNKFFEKGQITILELDALSNDDKTFFIEIILQWLRDWLLVSNKREKLQGVIVLEEAHHVLNREKTKKFGVETVTDLIFREIRELGIGMIYVDQHPSLVSYPALGNTSTHVYMNLGLDTKYSSDIQDASNMLGLREQDVDYLRRLPTGHAFILIRKSVFPNPFLIKFPLMPIEKGSITDDALREAMGMKLMEELKIKQPALKGMSPKAFAKNIVKTQNIEKRIKKVNSKGWKIIELLAAAEASYTSELYKKLKMSHKVFNKEANELIDLGFIATREGKVYKQTAVYHFLTHVGEFAYAMKSGKLPTSTATGKTKIDIKKTKQHITHALTLKGWAPLENSGNHMVFEENGKKRMINIEPALNRAQINKDVEKSAMDGEIYFVCSSDQIKNAVIQQAAKHSYRHRGMNIVTYAATLDDLKDRGFKRVEFSATR